MSTPRLANHAHVFPPSINKDGTIDRLLTLLDACQLDQAVCFAPFPHQCDGKDIEPNTWLAGELKSRSRLYAFGTVDVRRDDLVDQVRRIKELGFQGLKLHPNAQKFAILNPRMMDVYGAAQELKLFITFHSGVHQSRLSESRVIDFDEIAHHYPRLKFSLEHVGGYHFFHEALAVIFNNLPTPWEQREANVYGGLTSIFTTHQLRFWYMSPERMRELIAQVSADQLIFGLDFPYNLEKETQIAIKTLQDLNLPEGELDKILGGNLRKALGVGE